MATEHKEQVRIIQDRDYEQRQQVVEHAPSTRHVVVARVSQFIWWMVGIVVALIAFRFVLMLLAANPANAFASVIYSITDVLVGPFIGLLNTPAFEGGSVVDLASLVAIAVYLIVAAVVVQILHILFGESGGIRRVKTVRRERI